METRINEGLKLSDNISSHFPFVAVIWQHRDKIWRRITSPKFCYLIKLGKPLAKSTIENTYISSENLHVVITPIRNIFEEKIFQVEMIEKPNKLEPSGCSSVACSISPRDLFTNQPNPHRKIRNTYMACTSFANNLLSK